MEGAAPKTTMSTVLAINKLKYALPSKLSVVERRQNKISFADSNEYKSGSGNEVVIRLTASTDYVYGPNSYLTFDISGAAAAGDLGFKSHDAMSLFSRVLFEDRSGVELERNDKLNSYCAQVLPWHYASRYKETVKAMGGQFEAAGQRHTDGIPADPPVFQSNGTIPDYDIKDSAMTVCIPLRHFLGIFDRETLIPSMLLSGALLRLQLETPSVALQKLDNAVAAATVTATDFTISNARVVCDSMALSPVVQKNLLEQSQSGGGLDFTYETCYYQGANPLTSQNFNLQINKAVARVQKLYWSSHAASTLQQTDKDSLGTSKADVKALDYRVGDLYMPSRVIRCSGTTRKTGAELYENSLQSVYKMKTYMEPPSITKNVFLVSGPAISATASANDNSGRSVHVQSFEMSSSGEYSGLAINNSRTLEARIEFQTQAAGPRLIDAWIKYVKLAKCTVLRTIVKE